MTCGEVDHPVTGLAQADTDFVHLSGVDHILKHDPSDSAANYTAARPSSPPLEAALRSVVQHNL